MMALATSTSHLIDRLPRPRGRLTADAPSVRRPGFAQVVRPRSCSGPPMSRISPASWPACRRTCRSRCWESAPTFSCATAA